MPDDRRQDRDLDLNAFWNGLVRGEPDAAGDLDPELAETVRRLRAMAQTPPPGSARERARRGLTERLDPHQDGKETSMLHPGPLTLPGSGFAPNRPPYPQPARTRPAGSGARWRALRSATALLLVAAIVGGALVLGRHWPGAGRLNEIPAATERCGTAGGGASAPTASPAPVNLVAASPAAATNPTVSFVWATAGLAAGSPAPGNSGVGYLAIDPRCRLWVTDVTANRFRIYGLDGHLLDTWGTAGSGDGQFGFGGNGYFAGIAFASDGGFYVCDYANRRVQEFDANRRFVRSWVVTGGAAGQVAAPNWIAVGPDGNVYVVADTGSGVVQVFSPDGKLIRKFGNVGTGPGDLDSPGPVAFDPAGNVWMLVPSGPSLAQFSPTGERLASIDLTKDVGSFPFGLAIDASGRFLVADGNQDKVSVFDPTGNLLFSWGAPGPGGGQFLHHSLIWIALDGNGGVYTDEFGDERIQKFQVRP